MSSLAGSYNIVVVAVAGALAFFCFRIVLPSCFHNSKENFGRFDR